MAELKPMPPVTVSQTDMAQMGQVWLAQGEKLSRKASGQLGRLFDRTVAKALAIMLGGIPIVRPKQKALMPSQTECVEQGPVLIVGGVRPQHFDVGYRPDGVRFAFDSKTLNDTKSIGKNWRNMVNDLATEASTVHSRFPHAVVALMVIFPRPCVTAAKESEIIETLERLTNRLRVDEPAYMAEAVSFILWEPANGTIDAGVPDPSSPLRIEKFSNQVESAYSSRYRVFPPHDV